MLAYFETVRDGLVSCRVNKIVRRTNGALDISFTVTGNHRTYSRGYVAWSTSMHVIPRHAIRRRKYSTVVLPFSWLDEADKAGFKIEHETP
jgi:hypothetical protein